MSDFAPAEPAPELPPGFKWWKIVITAHVTRDPPDRATLGLSKAICGRSFYGGTGTSFEIAGPMFYPICGSCRRSLAKIKRDAK